MTGLTLLDLIMKCDANRKWPTETITGGGKFSTFDVINISNPTMRTGLDFKSAQFDLVRGETED